MVSNRWMIHNGEMIRVDEPVIPAGARTVRYGDGCFETLRGYNGAFLHLKEHLQRLRGGLNYLGIPLPEDIVQPERLIADLLEQNGLSDEQAVVRLQVWREGARGYSPTGEEPAGYALSADPLPEIKEKICLSTVPTCRIPAAAVDSRWKLSGGTGLIRAAREAQERGTDDALMLTMDGAISETTVANIFWVKGDTVFTPSTKCDLLPGITRRILINLIGESSSLDLREGSFSPEELIEAEAIWTCNSLRELQPVSKVDDHLFNDTHEVIQVLQKQFYDVRTKRSRII